jgi:hypothetical protein
MKLRKIEEGTLEVEFEVVAFVEDDELLLLLEVELLEEEEEDRDELDDVAEAEVSPGN